MLKFLAVTLSENHYGYKAFLYRIPKTILAPSHLYSPYYIVDDGNNKAFQGSLIEAANEIDIKRIERDGIQPGL